MFGDFFVYFKNQKVRHFFLIVSIFLGGVDQFGVRNSLFGPVIQSDTSDQSGFSLEKGISL